MMKIIDLIKFIFIAIFVLIAVVIIYGFATILTIGQSILWYIQDLFGSKHDQ